MLRSLKIENFRCFQNFELQQLGRINLLVGKNNSGKTSILEAIHLLISQSSLEFLKEVMISRGEDILNDELGIQRIIHELDIRHLFYGHVMDVGSKISISSNNSNIKQGIFISIDKVTQLKAFEEIRELTLEIKWLYPANENITLPLSPEEGLSLDHLRSIRKNINKSGVKTQFITLSSLTPESMINLFNRVVLTDEEDLVIEALRVIEPKIERIAPDDIKFRDSSSRIGFRIRLSDSDQPVPIGSMGDGIWRILGLTLAIVNAKNGVLLVDEIDTGLHFSTMSDMWKLIWETAKRLNVQVFATTHSDDCWKSLDAIASLDNPSEDGIMIHRIEKGKSHSVAFTERQVAIAAERGIEVR